MFKRILYPSLVAGFGLISNNVYCDDRWKVADDNKVSCFDNYSTFPEEFPVSYTYQEKEIVDRFNEDSKYLCKVSCKNSYPYYCTLSRMYELENDNGIFIPKGLDKKTTDRMIVMQDIRRFKTMDQSYDLRHFVITKYPKQIVNVKKPTFNDFKQAIKMDVDVYPLIKKFLSKRDIERLTEANGNIIKYVNDLSLYEIAVKTTPSSIKYIKNPDEKLQKIAIEYNWNNIQYIDNPTNSVYALVYTKGNIGSIKYMKKIPDRVIRMMLNKSINNIRYIPKNKQTLAVLEFYDDYWFFCHYRDGLINKTLFNEKNILKLISKTRIHDRNNLYKKLSSNKIKMTPMIYRVFLETNPELIKEMPLRFKGVKDVENKLYSKYPELKKVIDDRRKKR